MCTRLAGPGITGLTPSTSRCVCVGGDGALVGVQIPRIPEKALGPGKAWQGVNTLERVYKAETLREKTML